jgi:hypothetical protein
MSVRLSHLSTLSTLKCRDEAIGLFVDMRMSSLSKLSTTTFFSIQSDLLRQRFMVRARVYIVGGKRVQEHIYRLPLCLHKSFFLLYLQEGWKSWEHILSVSRNLSRIVTLYGKEVGNERLVRIKNLLAAYPYLLRHTTFAPVVFAQNLIP